MRTLVGTPDPEPRPAPAMPRLTWSGYVRVIPGEALVAGSNTATVPTTVTGASTSGWVAVTSRNRSW